MSVQLLFRGQGARQPFSLEGLHSLAVALGTPGLQLTILTLSFVELGNAGVKVLCEGLIKWVNAHNTGPAAY